MNQTLRCWNSLCGAATQSQRGTSNLFLAQLRGLRLQTTRRRSESRLDWVPRLWGTRRWAFLDQESEHRNGFKMIKRAQITLRLSGIRMNPWLPKSGHGWISAQWQTYMCVLFTQNWQSEQCKWRGTTTGINFTYSLSYYSLRTLCFQINLHIL